MEQTQKRKGIFTRDDLPLNRELKWEYRILIGLLFGAVFFATAKEVVYQLLFAQYDPRITEFSVNSVPYRVYSALTFISNFFTYTSPAIFAIIAVRFKKRPRFLFWVCYFVAALAILTMPYWRLLLPMSSNYPRFFTPFHLFRRLITEYYYMAENIRILAFPLAVVLCMKLIIPRIKKVKSSFLLIILSFLAISLTYLVLLALADVIYLANYNHVSSVGNATSGIPKLVIPYIINCHLLNMKYSIILFLVLVPLESLIFRQPPFNKAGMPLPVPDEAAENSTNAQEQSMPKELPPVAPTFIQYSGENIAKKEN